MAVSLMYVVNAQSKPSLLLNNAEMAFVVEVKDLGLLLIPVLPLTLTFARLWCELTLYTNVLCPMTFLLFCVLLKCKLNLSFIVEYASCVWSPYRVNQVELIESVHTEKVHQKTTRLRLTVL